jgi:serine/threonine protein kinase
MLQPGDAAFGRFSVIERLAWGAFSVVYKVRDLECDRELALKVELARDRPCAMLAHEHRVARLFDSPFVSRSVAFFESDVSSAAAMDLFSSTLIDVRRRRVDAPPLPMLANVALQCLRGLAVLHAAGVVHSDVKPSNFAFRVEGADYRVVTFDFGLSEFAGEAPEITAFRAQLKRNPRYISLRVHGDGAWRESDDFASLVYTIAEFWRDELPWDGRVTAALVLEVKQNCELASLLPPELAFLGAPDAAEGEAIARLEQVLLEYPRDIEAELHYIADPRDQGKQVKLVKYVFEPNANVPANQHSA